MAAQAYDSTGTDTQSPGTGTGVVPAQERERDFEGGFGGQEDLEDRYATTSGEH